MASTQVRPIGEIVNSGSFTSPLAQLSLAAAGAQLANPTPSRPPKGAPPPLDLNLFRSPSIYSVSSIASLSTISADEKAFTSISGSPTTPKASQNPQGPGLFSSTPPSSLPSPTSRPGQLGHGGVRRLRAGSESRVPVHRAVTGPSGPHQSPPRQLSPKRSFVVTSRQLSSPTQEHRDNPLKYRPVPGRSRHGHGHAHAHAPSNEAGPSSPRRTSHDVQLQSTPPVVYDITSMHGEQGYDWGEDESNFEWVDTDNAPEAANGDGKGHKTSPSKKLGKIKAAMSAGPGAHIPFEMRNESKKLKKQLVFPRRAPPPPPPGIAPHPNSPRSQSFSFSPAISHPTTLKPQVGLFSNLTVPDPRRPSFTRRAESERPPSGPNDLLRTTSTPVPSPDPSQASPAIPSQPELPTRPGPSPLMPTLMVPIKETDGSNAGSSKDDAQRYSQMSFQSAAYSFYDLESPGPSTPGAVTPTQARFDQTQQVEAGPSGDIGPRASVFPYGTYRKVSVSQLEREKETRDRDMSLPETRSPHFDADEEDHPPEFFIAKGIEARAKGNLPRSAWYFMKAAEKGSPTGRMYWGLSLRHGWGVARDDKKAFVELRQACDDSLFEGGVNFHQSPGTVKLSLQQKKSMTRDLSLGLFEVANCFLGGVGVKKAPDVAMSYLRFAGNLGDLAAQEQLGFLLSKGGNGVKKDMKEAAKWYRMAIGQGSTNTFGLAWVWKDKYMD